MNNQLDRRTFVKGAVSGTIGLWAGSAWAAPAEKAEKSEQRPEYHGPNVIIIRFGGGVRRLETIDADHTYAPYFRHELAHRGTLFTDTSISATFRRNGETTQVQTGHQQGTLNVLCGRYDRYEDVDKQPFREAFEPTVPTLFEYLRKAYGVAPHQALLVNNEDRTQEEFYSFSNHHLFGVRYRSNVLSLYRFKVWKLEQKLASGRLDDPQRAQLQKELARLKAKDYRKEDDDLRSLELEQFWHRWREYYGESGFVNPRGDRLLTELVTRALAELRPRLMMVNYTDPDYVHWGNMSHYTRGIAIIDQGLKRLVTAVEADPEYRDNTIFLIVPDCGRDSNPYMAVPCQHHFNTKSSRQVFALLFGPGIRRNVVVDKPSEQIQVAATVGHLMGFPTPFAEGPLLEEALA